VREPGSRRHLVRRLLGGAAAHAGAWALSAREAGLIQSAFHLGYLVSLFMIGFIADHFGAKRAYLTTGIAACASPWAFVLLADGFWSAFWLHALTGLCQGGTYTPALALINDHVERARRGRAMGYLIAGRAPATRSAWAWRASRSSSPTGAARSPRWRCCP